MVTAVILVLLWLLWACDVVPIDYVPKNSVEKKVL